MALNTLNRNKNAVPTIRFPMKGKIQSTAMKVNCLIQAALGSLPVTDPGLSMDTNKIFRSAKRVMSCLVAYVRSSNVGFKLSISTIQLAKCLEARMWENSDHVARQITGIGATLSVSLVNAGKFQLDQLGDLQRNVQDYYPKWRTLPANTYQHISHLR